MPLATFRVLIAAFLCGPIASCFGNSVFTTEIEPLLQKYCFECHGDEKVKGDIDFTLVTGPTEVEANFDIWELVNDVIEFEEMPPDDQELRPTGAEYQSILNWYTATFVDSVEAQAGPLKPRRLSTSEFRNTLHSLFGFDLQLAIISTEETRTNNSLVLKLLPTDPPGQSGFTNDTHSTPLSGYTWEQYAYIADRAINQLFSPDEHIALEKMLGQSLPADFTSSQLTQSQARTILRHFIPRAVRRPVPESMLAPAFASIQGLSGDALREEVQMQMKAILVSPQFLYRGLLFEGSPGQEQEVDGFELAERLSYFLWEDMPDEALLKVARAGDLHSRASLENQIDRMLASPRSHSLANSFAHQWFGLADLDDMKGKLVLQESLKNQASDFFHFLFTQDRPVIELIDSEIAFANQTTAQFYPQSRSQMSSYQKPKGIERQLTPNQQITLHLEEERGGILTMPAILAMNRGPILRGTWMLRRILGEHIGDPPADIPPIKAIPHALNLSFRERFEQHRNDPTCARCHDKIDPLGFAMQHYDDAGFYKLLPNYKPPRRKSDHDDSLDSIDTSGALPSGERFNNFEELKSILIEEKHPSIIRNAVEQTLAYALCRKLEIYDKPTVDGITQRITDTNGTWRDLFVEVALSLPFQKTFLSPLPSPAVSSL